MINIASRNWPVETHNNIEFVEGNVQKLPFADGSIDCIVSYLSLHHWQDAGEACKEINRVLKPGGQFLIFDLKRNSPRIFFYFLWLGQLMSPGAIKRTNGAIGSLWSSYTPRELQKIFLKESWQNLRIDGKLGWLIVSAVRS